VAWLRYGCGCSERERFVLLRLALKLLLQLIGLGKDCIDDLLSLAGVFV
jgi:hypothetical protein